MVTKYLAIGLLAITAACTLQAANPNEINLLPSETKQMAELKIRRHDLKAEEDALYLATKQYNLDTEKLVVQVRKAHDINPDVPVCINVEKQIARKGAE